MRRSVKYGLYGAVLAAVVGGTAAFTIGTSSANARPSISWSTGRPRTFTPRRTTSPASSRTPATPSAPTTSSPRRVTTPSPERPTIVYKRGRLLHLNVDGQARDVWTTEPTVAAGPGRPRLLGVRLRLGLALDAPAARRPPASCCARRSRSPSCTTAAPTSRSPRPTRPSPTLLTALHVTPGHDRHGHPGRHRADDAGPDDHVHADHAQGGDRHVVPVAFATRQAARRVDVHRPEHCRHAPAVPAPPRRTYDVVYVDGKLVKRRR